MNLSAANLRMLSGGLIVFAWSTFLASTLESAYLAVFIGLSTLAVLYLFIQPYAGAIDAPAWIRAVDIRHLMAGPEYSPGGRRNRGFDWQVR